MGTTNTNSVRRTSNPTRIRAVGEGADGHNYYLIYNGDARSVANVTFVRYYSSLNQYGPSGITGGGSDPSGFFFVRDAASNGPDHYGDPTVHAGWAMYIFDPSLFRPESSNSGWVKICQQGDIDWDITDELKSLFVLKTVYNVKMNQIDGNFQRIDGSVINMNVRVNVLEKDMAYVKPMAHIHWNRNTLDLLSSKHGILYYDNRPIGGNSYIYNHVEEVDGVREIVWCDPTIPREQWTHEVIDDSATIADLFCKTSFARIGLTLIVVEADGSLSLYKYTREATGIETYFGPYNISDAINKAVEIGYPQPESTERQLIADPGKWIISGDTDHPAFFTYDESSESYVQFSGEVSTIDTERIYYVYDPDGYIIKPKFAQTIVQDNLGLAEYVMMLPTAAKQYVGRGYWVPLVDDGVHIVNHLHKCVPIFAETQDAQFIVNKKYFKKTGEDAYEQLVAGTDYNVGDNVEDYDGVVYFKIRYEWQDATGSAGTLGLVGSVIDVCYAENHTMWTRNHIHFTIPPAGTKPLVNGTTATVKWAKTVIVRKFNKPPVSAADGEVVYTFTADRLANQEDTWFIDTVPFISHLKNDKPQYWYYRAFSTSAAGDAYSSDTETFPEVAAKAAKKLDWEMIYELCNTGKLGLVFKPGDEIYLPHHETYGDILCQIYKVESNYGTEPGATVNNGLYVVAKDVVCKKMLDNVELTEMSNELNPENRADEVPCGSNGALETELCPDGHLLDTLNIIVWLNDDTTNCSYDRTNWDVDPDYDDKTVGFMSGFSEEDRAIFAQFPACSDPNGTFYLSPVKVRLPFIEEFSNPYIALNRHFGHEKVYTEWATLTGVQYPLSNHRRKLCKFQLNSVEGNVHKDVFPQDKVGIVPMFFIKGLNPNRQP